MRTYLAIITVCALALLFVSGCTGQNNALPTENASISMVSPNNAVKTILPRSAVDYTAQYTVYENGVQIGKTFYIMGNNARMDFENGQGLSFSLYVLGGKAYSCSQYTGKGSCYEITSTLAGKPPPGFESYGAPPQGAATVGTVNIGGTTGRCYLSSFGTFGKRKTCYTDRGALAYDEYNQSVGQAHVEYATSISYGANEKDFELPFEPSPIPEGNALAP
ncbi:MAG: hypothetical protein NT051_05630 [Candidatus Micrarchaeota archaeon]|nr:hypothetical protein [Candidatus Micrarchaeota archaeon]